VIALAYASELVEEAVLLSERTLSAADRRAFRRDRDRIYEIADVEERDRRFRILHRDWFVRLDLGRAIEDSVSEPLGQSGRLRHGRVVYAISPRDEGADLVDHVNAAGDTEPLLVIRLRPATLMDAFAVATLLRHELTHVADMLDPVFGYQRTLPPRDEGPSADTIVRDRYRVLWDVTIDGRLARSGHGTIARATRWAEFAATFPMLGEQSRELFDRWFTLEHPTHAALAAFACDPGNAHEVCHETSAASC
jgi:hypothetical protein